MKLYPVHLLLEGKPALVVGGGEVAAAKAKTLQESGATVRVIAPELSPQMRELAGLSGLSVDQREFTPEDLRDIQIVIAATDLPEVNQAVFEEAQRRGILVCSVDDPSRSNFVAPAVLRRGDLVLTVSTSGRAPALASRIRDCLGEIFGEDYAYLLVRLGDIREQLKREYPDRTRRREAWYRLIDTRILPALRRREPVSLESDSGAVQELSDSATTTGIQVNPGRKRGDNG
jgi:siroheme synthase-like protein